MDSHYFALNKNRQFHLSSLVSYASEKQLKFQSFWNRILILKHLE